jgi:mRNA (guanine-N7-)-methyltransferase
VYAENHERPEFKDLLIKMKVIDPQGVSAMDEDQWEAASKFFPALWVR